MGASDETSAFRSPVFYAGLAMYLGAIAVWVTVWLADETAAYRLAAAFGAFLAGGKLVGVSTGVALEGDPWIVGSLITLADVGTVFVLYPFTDAGLDRLGKRFHRLGRSLEEAHKRGERREGFVPRYGPWGLFLITLLPAGYYSPVVVATLGHVLGLRPAAVLLPVGIASLLSTLAYALLLDAGFAQATQFQPWIPWAITLAFLVLIPLGRWLWNRAKGRGKATSREEK